MKSVNPCGLMRAALINDLSCFGKCSLSVAIPILSSYGVETVPLPTAILSTHTGGFTGFVVQNMTENMRLFAAHWKKLGVKFDAIITGYCCTVEQIKLTAEFIRSFSDTDTLVIVDPVLGDHEALYTGFTDAHVDAMRELCSLADLITPNRTEAALLAGLSFSSADETLLYAQQVKDAVITSVGSGNRIGYLARLDGRVTLVQKESVDMTVHGAGDVFTSALSGELLSGQAPQTALLRAADARGDLHFIGNIEAKEAIKGGCDVIVTDGFSGNILLKTMEGVGSFAGHALGDIFKKNLLTKLAAAMVMPGLRAFKAQLDPNKVGGTAFIGISKPVIKAHGASNAEAIDNAIGQARQVAESGIIGQIQENVHLMQLQAE